MGILLLLCSTMRQYMHVHLGLIFVRMATEHANEGGVCLASGLIGESQPLGFEVPNLEQFLFRRSSSGRLLAVYFEQNLWVANARDRYWLNIVDRIVELVGLLHIFLIDLVAAKDTDLRLTVVI